MVRFRAIQERLRLSLWFIPALIALAAAVLAVVLLAVDRAVTSTGDAPFIYGGTPEGARSVLSTIAQSMLTFTGLVFTITMLVLQLASSQLSPRVMRTFLRDRGNQVVLGLFVATFVYTLLVQRDVRTPVDGGGGFVPGLSVWVAFALLIASVAAFVYYIDHMAHAIRASTVIANIAAETVETIDRLYPERVARTRQDSEPLTGSELGPSELALTSPRAGVVVAVDDDLLLETAGEGDRRIELIPAVGEFVPEGAPLVRLWGRWDRDAADRIREAIGLGGERTLTQDPAFGFRQLVDIALRALSPGTNDPTTAVQALDRIHDLLRRLALRAIPPPIRADVSGVVRVIRHGPGWDDFVRLGLDEIRLAGSSQLQVALRIRRLLDDLLSVAPESRLPVLRDELMRLDDMLIGGYADGTARPAAGRPPNRAAALVRSPRDDPAR